MVDTASPALAPATGGLAAPPPSRWRGLAGSTLARHLFFGAVAAALLLGLTRVASPYRDYQLAEVATYLVAIAGLTVLTGLNGQISLGHGALMMIGAYTTGLLIQDHGWSVWPALVAAIVTTALAGVVVGAAAARLRGPYLAGATLALAVGLPSLPTKFSGLLGGDTGVSVTVTAPASLGATFPLERWEAWICLLGAVVTMILLANLTRSRIGRSFRAVRDDEVAASLAGLHVARTQVLAFVVSAACAGLAGGLLAVVLSLVNPGSFQLTLSIALLTGIVLGGLGSLTGAVWGALALVALPQWASDLFAPTSKVGANLPLAVYGLVLIGVILLFPRGIQGALRQLSGLLLARRPGSTARTSAVADRTTAPIAPAAPGTASSGPTAPGTTAPGTTDPRGTESRGADQPPAGHNKEAP